VLVYADLQEEFDLLAMSDTQNENELIAMGDVQEEYELLASQEPWAFEEPEINNTDYDELFYEVFGYRQVKPYKLLVPYFINGSRVGKIEVFLKKGADQIHVRKTTLYNKLGRVINKPLMEWLVGATLNLNTVNLAFLEENNIFTDYDDKLLRFEISVPPEYIKPNTSKLGYINAPDNIDYAISPSKYSGYLNFRANQSMHYTNFDGIDQSTTPFALNFDGAINIYKVVLEGLGEYSKENKFERRMTRIVYDQPEYMFRYYLGDLSIPIIGYQTAPQMGGIAFTKDFNLQPYKTTQPETMDGVVILRPSTVEIYANDVLMEKTKINPGPFNLRQASFNYGINNVKVIIKNDIGEEEVIDMNSYFNNLQLKGGLDQYSVNLGVTSQRNSSNIEYNEGDPIISMFYRRGLNSNITLSAYTQLKRDQFMFGSGSNFGTILGNFDVDLAFSGTDSVSFDLATRVTYSYFYNNYKTNPFQRQWRASFEYLGENYASLNSLLPQNLISYIISGSVSQNITETINSSFNASYGFGRGPHEDFHTYSLSVAKRISSSMRISCSISNREEGTSYDSWRASLNFTYNPPINHIFNSVYDSRNNAGRVNWTYQSKDGSIVNRLSTNSSEYSPLTVSNSTTYSGNRGNLSLSYDFNESQYSVRDNNIDFTASTGIVFVDGQFGWGKAISNSFALIKTNNTIKKYKVGINKTRNGSYQFSSDKFGPAIYSDLSPYKVQEFNIEMPDLPMGYEVNSDGHILLPTYKSGFLIDLEGEAYIFARGQLVDVDNKPMANVVAELVPFGKYDEDYSTIFTNKAGYFYAYGLKPGSYKLFLDSDKYEPIIVRIARNTEAGYCKLGTLVAK
jgi:outer membrane usher protein